jgi:hypothetical protein
MVDEIAIVIRPHRKDVTLDLLLGLPASAADQKKGMGVSYLHGV